MARPTKQGIDYFPLWKPQYRTEEKFWGNGDTGYQSLRNSSSAFTKRKDVREIIFSKNNWQCVFCGGTERLTVDHIITVYQAYKDKRYIGILNSYQNLQTLCLSCNSKKSPDKQWEE